MEAWASVCAGEAPAGAAGNVVPLRNRGADVSDETLAEILPGLHEPTGRAALHAMLDDLLDAAEEGGGTRLDAPAFWAFVAKLARGRGIADDIAEAAARHIAEAAPGGAGGVAEEEQALATFRMWQWSLLTALLRRVTALPGEIVPRDLIAAPFIAAADNIVGAGGAMRGGEHMDLLGLGTPRGSDRAAKRRALRRLLVGAVCRGGTSRAISDRGPPRPHA